MSRLASRLQLSAIKPMSPNGHQPIPPGRRSSMSRVVNPADPDYPTAIAAAQGVPGSAIDTSIIRAGTFDPNYSTIGTIGQVGNLLIPGSVNANR